MSGIPSDGLEGWIALTLIPGLGPAHIRRLVEELGDPPRVFQAGAGRLAQVAGLTPALVQGIARFDRWAEARQALQAVERIGALALPFTNAAYPRLLLQTYEPPPLLYVRGALAPEDGLALAVVGTRKPTPQGVHFTEEISSVLASRGLTIVSGLARGIDSAAHRGALRAGGRTIAVLGSGIDRIYPPEHSDLADRIARQGAVISEFPLGTKPDRYHFPYRNRIISGLSLGVLVVEAAAKSGALITAQYALDEGREVFAVPGSVRSAVSKGPHELIKKGARLVEGVEDILDELPRDVRAVLQLPAAPAAAEPVELTFEEQKLYSLVRETGSHIDQLIEASGLPASRVASLLVQLELRGVVAQFPGHVFIRAR